MAKFKPHSYQERAIRFVEEGQIDLGLVSAVGFEVLFIDVCAARDLRDGREGAALGDFDVGKISHGFSPPKNEMVFYGLTTASSRMEKRYRDRVSRSVSKSRAGRDSFGERIRDGAPERMR